MKQIEELQRFAKQHPYVALGIVLFPAVYGVTGKWWMALFVTGLFMIAPELGDAFSDEEAEEEEPDKILEGLDPWDKG